MKCLEVLVAIFVLVLVSAGPATADAKADPREKPETAILEGIRLLEAKDYATFLKDFVPPDELKKMTENAGLDEFAKQFGEQKAARLLQVLKSIKDVKPTLDPDGKRVYYELNAQNVGKKGITWMKVDKYWYIQN